MHAMFTGADAVAWYTAMMSGYRASCGRMVSGGDDGATLEEVQGLYGGFMYEHLANDTSKTRQGIKHIWYDLCNLRIRKL